MTRAEQQPIRLKKSVYRRSAETELAADGFNVNDQLGNYLHELRKIPIPTREEEVALATRIEKGRIALKKLTAQDAELKPSEIVELRRQRDEGEAAREELIKKNLRLVVDVAKRYQGGGVPLLDLIQEGNIGLLHATEKYDRKRGFKFSTYATWWIRRYVTYAIPEQGRTIYIPVHVNDWLREVQAVQYRLLQQLDHKPSAEEISKELPNIPLKEVKLLLEESKRKPLSLDTLGEQIADPNQEPAQDRVTDDMLRKFIQNVLLPNLPPREARVLRLRFGLDDGGGMTLEEVGQKMGITRERVRQIEADVLLRLRNPKYRRILGQYV